MTIQHPGELRPDAHAGGFLAQAPDPYRYDHQPNDPEEVVGVISGFVPAGSTVLDVGCGTGSVSIQIARNCSADVIGLEPDGARAQLARGRGLNVLTEELSPDVIRRLGAFDVVVFADVLEHLPDPLSMLSLAMTALKPGGRIVASIPNVAHWSVRIDLMRGRFDYRECGIMDATHLRWFTESAARNLFERAGLHVERIGATGGCDLDCYLERWPWRRLSRDTRKSVIRRCLRRWPRLFACQWVVDATPT